MWFLGLGLLGVALKFLEIGPVAQWSWLVVLIPFGLAADQPLSHSDFFISEGVFAVWIMIFWSLSRWLEQPRQASTTGIAAPPPPPKPL